MNTIRNVCNWAQAWLAKRYYSIFDLKYFLKITGARASDEKARSMKIELHENAIDELVILYSVLPASIAMKDGGATLKKRLIH